MRHVRTTGAIVVLLVIAGGGFRIWDMHRRTINDARSDMRDLGVVLADQATRYVQVVDQLLLEERSRSQDLGIRTQDEFRRRLGGEDTHQFLQDRLKNLPQAHAAGLFDADGILVNSSRGDPIVGFSIAARGYFRHARDDADSGVFVSLPGRDRASGPLSIFLVRRISGPDGAFLGAVVASVDVDYLLNLYQIISRERRLGVTLLRRDGALLARYPTIAINGRTMPAVSEWHKQVAAGGGTYLSSGYFSGSKAIVSVTPLRDYPLVIDVSIRNEDVLATWWHQAAYMLGGELVLGGVLVALFWMIARQLRRQEENNAALTRTADALRASETRLRDFVEMASDWLWEQDAELRFTEISMETPLLRQGDRSHLGKRRSEVNDTSKAPEHWANHVHGLLARKPFRDFRYDRVGPDGKSHHVSISGTPVYDDTGQFAGYRGTGRDITTAVEAEAELRATRDRAEQAETLLHDAVASISEGFVFYDNQDRLILCNDAYRRLYPASAPLMVPGVKYEELVRNSLSAGHYPSAVGREEEWLADLMRAHQAADTDIEAQVRGGKWVLMTERRMRNGGIVGLRIDITALKQAQSALRESEERLDRAQAIAGIGSWELDVSTKHYVWSKELYRIRGLSPAEFDPTMDSVEPYLHLDDHATIRTWISELIEGREEPAREIRIVRPDGAVRLLYVDGRALKDPDGVIRRLAGTMQDITDRRLVDRQLMQAQKMEAIGNLTGGMAHDFNNGLAVIIGNLDLLARMVEANGTATEVCDEAREAALRCADLIRGLLAFARRQPLRPRQTDVNALIKETARLLSRTLGEGITLKLRLNAALSPAMADAAQLEAAVVNLAMNARDAMPNGGQLDIGTRDAELDAQYVALHPEAVAGNYVLIEVSDAGTGIPTEILGRIFEPFFTTKEPGQGSGLGLSMVFGFVKQSGGHLDVYSEPGHGTTFRIYLPRARTNDAKVAVPADQQLVVGGDETILVVEDNPQLRQVAARQLAGLGYRVLTAENAEAALPVLASEDGIDLLFTDVVMPGAMNGIGLARHAIRQRSGLAILLASGFPGAGAPGERMRPSEFLLLGKPYRIDELARAVRQVLDRRDQQSPDHARRHASHGDTAARIDSSLITQETV